MDKQDPPSQKPTTSYMSPKLREKLEGGGGDSGGRTPREDPDQLPPWAGVLVVGLLLAAVAVVGMGIARSNAEKKRLAAVAHADSLKAAVFADSVSRVQRDSLRADSLRASLLPKPKPKPSPPAPSASAGKGAPATGAAPVAPAETRHYGLAVGEFLDEDKANSEKDRLASSTGLPGRVVPIDKGASFRVILGSTTSLRRREGRGRSERQGFGQRGSGHAAAQVMAIGFCERGRLGTNVPGLLFIRGVRY